ncbi:Ubiquinone biosynthesis protein coq9, mitochondrial [Balamuthia mandrillaris]
MLSSTATTTTTMRAAGRRVAATSGRVVPRNGFVLPQTAVSVRLLHSPSPASSPFHGGGREHSAAPGGRSLWQSSRPYSAAAAASYGSGGEATKKEKKKEEKKQKHEDKVNEQETAPQQNEQEHKELKKRILAAAKKHVPKLGWTQEAIAAAAEEEGLSSAAHGLFPRGPVELVEAHLDDCLQQLKNEITEPGTEGTAEEKRTEAFRRLRTKDKIKTLVRGYLEKSQAPFNSQWPQALALLAQPQNAPMACGRLVHLMDDMWHLCGDVSTDFNWYTKRAMLTGIYTSTQLYMLTDASENFEHTWSFLDRRIEDINWISQYKDQINSAAASALQLFSSFVAQTTGRGGATSHGGPSATSTASSQPQQQAPSGDKKDEPVIEIPVEQTSYHTTNEDDYKKPPSAFSSPGKFTSPSSV